MPCVGILAYQQVKSIWMKRKRKENQNLQIAVFRSFWLVKKLSYCRRFHIVEASSMDGLGSNDALITIIESDLVAYIKSLTGDCRRCCPVCHRSRCRFFCFPFCLCFCHFWCFYFCCHLQVHHYHLCHLLLWERVATQGPTTVLTTWITVN